MENNGGDHVLDQGSEKLSDSACILKVEPVRFSEK